MGINDMAEMAFKNALKRGKTMIEIDHEHTVRGMLEEFNEFMESSETSPSEHIPDVSESVEELADILICCMTELYRRNINVEKMVMSKIRFNQTRID